MEINAAEWIKKKKKKDGKQWRHSHTPLGNIITHQYSNYRYSRRRKREMAGENVWSDHSKKLD